MIDLQKVTVVLARPEDTSKLRVRVSGPTDVPPDRSRLADVLRRINIGRLTDTGDAFIRPEALRFYSAGSVGDGWEDEFQAMCAAALRKGWGDPADGFIQAHVVWPAVGQ